MNRNIYIVLLAVVLLPFGNIQAQSAPGLVGNRFSLFYNMDFFYNSLLFTRNEAEKDISEFYNRYDGVAFASFREYATRPFLYTTAQHSLQLDYAVSRIRSIGVGVSYFGNGYGTYGNADVYSRNLNVVTGSFFVKNYKAEDGSMAPLGKYQQWGLHFSRITDVWVENSQYFSDPQRFSPKPVTIVPGLTYTYGRQELIKGQFLVNYGVEIGMVFPLPQLGSEELFSDVYDAINTLDIESATQRWALFNIFRFKVGVGLAPF